MTSSNARVLVTITSLVRNAPVQLGKRKRKEERTLKRVKHVSPGLQKFHLTNQAEQAMQTMQPRACYTHTHIFALLYTLHLRLSTKRIASSLNKYPTPTMDSANVLKAAPICWLRMVSMFIKKLAYFSM